METSGNVPPVGCTFAMDTLSLTATVRPAGLLSSDLVDVIVVRWLEEYSAFILTFPASF